MQAFPSLLAAEFANACRQLETRAFDNLHGTDWLSCEFRIHRRSSYLLRRRCHRSRRPDLSTATTATTTATTTISSPPTVDDHLYDHDGNKNKDPGVDLDHHQHDPSHRLDLDLDLDPEGYQDSDENDDDDLNGQGMELLIRQRQRLDRACLDDDDEQMRSPVVEGRGRDEFTLKNADDARVHNRLVDRLDLFEDKEDEDDDELVEDILEDDTDTLRRATSTSTATTSHPRRPMVDFSIVLSPTYGVPVLWFSFPDSSSVQAGDITRIYTQLVTTDFQGSLQQVGVMGGISIANHPITDKASFFIHPCNTPFALQRMVEDGARLTPFEYIQLWFGIVGAAVGLHLPSKLAAMESEQTRPEQL